MTLLVVDDDDATETDQTKTEITTEAGKCSDFNLGKLISTTFMISEYCKSVLTLHDFVQKIITCPVLSWY